MSKNKQVKFNEIKTFENVIQAPFNLVKNNNFYLRGSWAKKFFNNENPVILEAGCGKGEYAIALAVLNPHYNYIGIDIKGARLWKGAKTALEKNIKNVRFLRTNIEIIDQFFEPSEVDEIWLTFPDPQMKKTRKRLTSTRFMEKYRMIMKDKGIIHLKTDSRFQYIYTKELARLNDFEILAETQDLYHSEILNETLQIKTFYEKQWLYRGIPIKYLSFTLSNNELKEPDMKIEKDKYRSFGRSERNN